MANESEKVEQKGVKATYAGAEVIGAKHNAVVVKTGLGSKSTDFLTHRLRENLYEYIYKEKHRCKEEEKR